MTLGEKIKYLRKFRGMTQKEFGTAVGLDDNRIAQYETNYRVPKRDLLINMAKALNVDPLAFIPDYYGFEEEVLHTFFWMEEDFPNSMNLFPIVPSKTKYNHGHGLTAEFDDNDDMPVVNPVGVWFSLDTVNRVMGVWVKIKQMLESEKITKDNYIEWKFLWPQDPDWLKNTSEYKKELHS